MTEMNTPPMAVAVGPLTASQAILNPPAIEVANLTFSYRNHHALSGVSFRVEPGSIHGFVGPNGAGKTTTLKILATLMKPQGGRAQIFGNDVGAYYKQVRAFIGFMPDHFSMYRQMTVSEYLDFFAAAYGMDAPKRVVVVRDVLALTDMAARKDDLVSSLSRGMQQRVSLARVLVHDPKLLLLDEPASGLDPRARIELMEILKELRRMGKTIFISSHILTELGPLCDSFTIIDRGRVRYTGHKNGLMIREGGRRSFLVGLDHFNEAAEQALKAVPGVQDAARLEDEGLYRVVFDGAQTGPNAILRALLDAQSEVRLFHEDGGQIQQAFMQLTEPGITT